ncbi:MAG: hypothetical protein KF768_04030 [Phycisphaeraceae bacterium]|nr:hypothetical protein [Phycisphaeraceae bacterium]
MEIRAIGGIVAAIIVFVAIGVRFMNKGEHGDQYLDVARQVVQKSPAYGWDNAYMDHLCKQAHEYAFSQSYDMGTMSRRGRGKKGTLNEAKYWPLFFDSMVRFAHADGRANFVPSIEKLRKDFQEGKL